MKPFSPPNIYSNFQFDDYLDLPVTVLDHFEWAHGSIEGGGHDKSLKLCRMFCRLMTNSLLLFPLPEPNGQYDNFDQDTSSVASEALSDCIVPSPLIDIPGSTLGLGSLVEVDVDAEKTLHGVIRWIGQKTTPDGLKMANNGYGDAGELVVGVELDEPCIDRRLKLNLTDGVYNGQRCFRCPERRAIFVAPKRCTKDRRFPDDIADTKSSSGSIRSTTPSEGRAFGADCPIIEGSVPALSELKATVGWQF
jgi:hypothetical protein